MWIPNQIEISKNTFCSFSLLLFVFLSLSTTTLRNLRRRWNISFCSSVHSSKRWTPSSVTIWVINQCTHQSASRLINPQRPTSDSFYTSRYRNHELYVQSLWSSERHSMLSVCLWPSAVSPSHPHTHTHTDTHTQTDKQTNSHLQYWRVYTLPWRMFQIDEGVSGGREGGVGRCSQKQASSGLLARSPSLPHSPSLSLRLSPTHTHKQMDWERERERERERKREAFKPIAGE